MTDNAISTLAPPQTVAMEGKMSTREKMSASAVAGGRVSRRLVAQWYRDAEGVLTMRWTMEVELDEGNPSATSAA